MTKVNYSLKMTDAQIVAAIPAIAKSTKTVQGNMHKLLVSILARWVETGDVRPAVKNINLLLAELDGTAIRTNAIKAWTEGFAGFVWNTEEKVFVAGTTKAKDVDVTEAAGAPFWQFSPEKAYQPFNLAAELAKIAKKAADRAKKADERDAIHSADVEALNKLIASLVQPAS